MGYWLSSCILPLGRFLLTLATKATSVSSFVLEGG